MHLAKMGLFSIAIIGLLGQPLNGQEEATANTWIRRSSASVELLFRGRVLSLNGVVDETATVQVIDHPDPLANRPRVRDIRVENGEFRFASDGLGFLTLYACSEDRMHQAVRQIPDHELASFARSGHFDIQLKPSKPLLIQVVDDGVSVANAKVLVQAGWMLNLKGQSDEGGIAKIAMPQGQEPNSIRVWTEDFRLGSLDFRDSSKRDVNKSFHTVELSGCKPMKVRVVDADGKPKPDFAQDEKPLAAVEAVKEPNDTNAIHEQLRAMREEFIAAVNAKDYEAVVLLLHPEVILTAQDGKKLNLIRRHEGVRKYFNRLLVNPGHGVESLKLAPTVDDLSVLYHNNTAVAFGSSMDHYRLVNGSEFDYKMRWSATVVKEGDKWLIANLHVSTNLFENPVLATVSRMAMWLAIGAGFVCLVAGLFIGRLRSRPIEA